MKCELSALSGCCFRCWGLNEDAATPRVHHCWLCSCSQRSLCCSGPNAMPQFLVSVIMLCFSPPPQSCMNLSPTSIAMVWYIYILPWYLQTMVNGRQELLWNLGLNVLQPLVRQFWFVLTTVRSEVNAMLKIDGSDTLHANRGRREHVNLQHVPDLQTATIVTVAFS